MMRAVICRSGGETAYSDAPFEYAASHPEPALGGLHAAFPELPCPAASTVLIRVGFSSMNPADRGTDDHRTPKVMGSDVCGTVIAAGAGCTRLKVGDEVFALTRAAWDIGEAHPESAGEKIGNGPSK